MTRIKFLLIALVLYVVSMNLSLHENHSNAYLLFTIYMEYLAPLVLAAAAALEARQVAKLLKNRLADLPKACNEQRLKKRCIRIGSDLFNLLCAAFVSWGIPSYLELSDYIRRLPELAASLAIWHTP